MPFRSQAQQRFAFATGQPWAKRWADETDFSKLPKRIRKKMRELKDAGTVAGAMLGGPGGLMATPGMGGRKWGNRRKDKACTCGVVTKESLGPGITRIRGNLCNVHGRYGPCDAALSKKPRGGKGKKPKKAAAPKPTAEERAQTRNQERTQRRDQVLADMGIDPGASEALVMLRNGEQPEPAALARAGAIEAGLVEQAADGSYRMTPSGRALIAAAEAGDPGRAGDVISAARDRKAARTARERATAQKKLDAANKRAEAAAAAAEKKPAKGGGGGSASSDREAERQNTRQQRESERQEDRKRREEERQADRSKREAERQEDRATRQRERAEDRRLALEERRARQRGPAVPRANVPIVRPGRRKRPNAVRNTTKAQTAQERAIHANIGGGSGGGGGKGGGGSGWKKGPDGKRHPSAAQVDTMQSKLDADKAKLEKNPPKDRVDAMRARSRIREQQERIDDHKERAEHAHDRLDHQLRDKRNEINARLRRVKPNTQEQRDLVRYLKDIEDAISTNKRNRRELEQAGKSFTVFKDDTDAWRWLARTTTAYRDRDGEIITTKALEQDAARMTATGVYGPLRYWHIGQPDPLHPTAPWGVGVDIGDCDYSVVIGRTSIESGTFKSHAIGRAFAESAADYELSPGFFHPPAQPNAAGEYDDIRRFERSVVPVAYGRASNLFTGMTVKEARMDDATYKARVDAFLKDMNAKGVPEQVAANALHAMQQADKSAAAQGIAFKSEEQPADPWAAVVAALKNAVQPAVPEPVAIETKAEGDMPADEMIEAGATEMDDGEAEEVAEAGGEYIGDMTPAEFWEQLQQYLAPVLKMQEMHKALSDMVGELKGMGAAYATKDAGMQARLDTIETTLKALIGDQPAVTSQADVIAALKGEPQPAADPSAVDIPNDPSRPFAPMTAALMPQLYSQYDGVNGWQRQPNTGGN